MSQLSTEQIHKGLTQMLNVGEIDDETKNVIDAARTIVGAFPQVLWERSLAIEQLKELGYGLGEKIEKEEKEKESGN